MHEQNSCPRLIIPQLTAIGVIHTAYRQAKGTPVQGVSGGGEQGIVEIYPEYAEGLLDVAGFERLWLITLLDRASAPQLIAKPYLDTQEHGVFATRAPARPNPIGLSVVRLLSVEGDRLIVADVDMLDGTPLLDLKPYVPAFDCFAMSRTGWYQGRSAQGAVADDRFEMHGLGDCTEA